MAVYSVFVASFVVVEAENEDDAAEQAHAWFAEMVESGEIEFEVVEGDATEDMEEDEEEG